MKFAIHLSTYTKSYSENIIPYIKRSHEIGYDAIEIPVLQELSYDLKELRAAAEYYNMDILCSTGLSEETDVSSTNKTIRQNGIDFMKQRIDIANALGSKQFTGVIYSPWGLLQSKEAGAANIANSIASMQEIADYAKSDGIMLGLEILNRYEGYMINTVEEGLAFIKKADRPNLKLHFDTFHAHIEEKSMYEALKLGGKDLVHIHFCENTRGTPLTGQVRWDEVKKGIEEISYDRYISIENFVNTNCEVGNSAMIWRQVEKDGDTAAVNGLKNMRKLFEV